MAGMRARRERGGAADDRHRLVDAVDDCLEGGEQDGEVAGRSSAERDVVARGGVQWDAGNLELGAEAVTMFVATKRGEIEGEVHAEGLVDQDAEASEEESSDGDEDAAVESDSGGVSCVAKLQIAPQLRELLKRDRFHRSLQQRFDIGKADDNIEGDVCDGAVYEEQDENGLLGNNISLTWTPLFKSDGDHCFWPFYWSVNEIPHSVRKRSDNLLMPGSLPVKSSVPDFQNLYGGISVPTAGLSKGCSVKAVVPVGVCDQPANRSFSQFVSHYNSYRCRSVCEVSGETVLGKGILNIGENVEWCQENPPLGTVESSSLTSQSSDSPEPILGTQGPSASEPE